MARATGKTHYIAEQDGNRWRVVRINPIGQGWGVADYMHLEDAYVAVTVLNALAPREAK